MELLGIFSLALLVYIWAGYIILLKSLSLFRRPSVTDSAHKPSVTVLLAVFNEEKCVRQRIENILQSDYPQDRIEVLVASDGSTDMTDKIVASLAAKDRRIRIVNAGRAGKSAAQNAAMPFAKGEVIVITDAETIFEKGTIASLARHFSDESVGCVSGRLILRHGDDGAISEGQGVYWKFEMVMRRLESSVGVLHTASGSVMAVRRSCFRRFEPRFGDDCVIPLDILALKKRVVHDDDAVAFDSFPSTFAGEFKARQRMTQRNITGTLSRYRLLNFLRFPLISVAILSHKVLRWLTPFFMATLFFSTAFVVKESWFWALLFFCQVVFYAAGIAGFAAYIKNLRIPLASQVFSFLIANAGFFLGVIKSFSRDGVTIYKTTGNMVR